jgi:hypothetical protein
MIEERSHNDRLSAKKSVDALAVIDSTVGKLECQRFCVAKSRDNLLSIICATVGCLYQ